MKNPIVLLIAALFLFSCKDATTNTNAPETTAADSTAVAKTDTDANAAVRSTLEVGTFSNTPPQVNACACYFSNDSTELITNKYVYVDNIEKYAFVVLNGTITQLEKKSETSNDVDLIKVFSNDQYEATLDVKLASKLNHNTQWKGRLSLKSKQGTIIIKNVTGECRCK